MHRCLLVRLVCCVVCHQALIWRLSCFPLLMYSRVLVHHIPDPEPLHLVIWRALSLQSTYNAPYVYCEYAFHGEQSRYTCCPLGFTGQRELPNTCGCRDDLDQTPYRMGAVIAAPPSSASTTFAFNLALVETQWMQDFDGLDYDQGLAVGEGVRVSGGRVRDCEGQVELCRQVMG